MRPVEELYSEETGNNLTITERLRMTAWALLGLAGACFCLWLFGRIVIFGRTPEAGLTPDFFVTAHFGFEIGVFGCLGSMLALVRAVFFPRWAIRLHNYFCERVNWDHIFYIWLFAWFSTWLLFGGLTRPLDMLYQDNPSPEVSSGAASASSPRREPWGKRTLPESRRAAIESHEHA